MGQDSSILKQSPSVTVILLLITKWIDHTHVIHTVDTQKGGLGANIPSICILSLFLFLSAKFYKVIEPFSKVKWEIELIVYFEPYNLTK